MKKLLVTLALLCAMINVYAQELTFATEATYPPYESVTSSGKIIGFDVDIMQALCQQMHATCKIVNAPFDSLIPSLQIGKFDAVIASMSITEQRKKVIDFTNSYYDSSASFIAKKNSGLMLSPAGLAGKTIGTQGDTTMYQYLKATYGSSIKINTYASQESAFLDLTSGRVDAVMGDSAVVGNWLTQDNHSAAYVFVGGPIKDSKFFSLGTGIAVKKGNAELVQQLNRALVEIKRNGVYQQLTKKWFDQ